MSCFSEENGGKLLKTLDDLHYGPFEEYVHLLNVEVLEDGQESCKNKYRSLPPEFYWNCIYLARKLTPGSIYLSI